jgi:hypothetical protein
MIQTRGTFRRIRNARARTRIMRGDRPVVPVIIALAEELAMPSL